MYSTLDEYSKFVCERNLERLQWMSLPCSEQYNLDILMSPTTTLCMQASYHNVGTSF